MKERCDYMNEVNSLCKELAETTDRKSNPPSPTPPTSSSPSGDKPGRVSSTCTCTWFLLFLQQVHEHIFSTLYLYSLFMERVRQICFPKHRSKSLHSCLHVIPINSHVGTKQCHTSSWPVALKPYIHNRASYDKLILLVLLLCTFCDV